MLNLFVLQIFTIAIIAIAMVVICLQGMRQRRFVCTVNLVIMGIVVWLSLLVIGEYIGTTNVESGLIPTTLCCFLGYVFRPICLYLFILLAKREFGKLEKLAIIPLAVNVLVYATSLFLFCEPLARFAFYYVPNEAGTMLVHHRGIFNYFAHVLSAVYLVWLIIISIRRLRGKHLNDAFSILICAGFVTGAVIIEMRGLVIGALNVSIAASTIFYYLFLLREDIRRDALTGLFDRKTFYSDIKRFGNKVTAAVQIDMNGLKTLNDGKGHEAGDEGLKAIAEAIKDNVPHSVSIYRIGGDEFTLLITSTRGPDLEQMCEAIRKEVAVRGYSVSIGYCVKKPDIKDIDALLSAADQLMYADKAAYYRSHPEVERRGR